MKSIINHTRDLLKVIEKMEFQLSNNNISISRLKTAKASITQPADNQLITWNENLSMLANSLWHLPAADGAAVMALGTDGAGQLGWYGIDELIAVGLTDGYVPYYDVDHLVNSIIFYDDVNNRIGINEAAPDSTLEVGGTGHFTDTLRTDGLLDANSGADIEGAVNIQSTLTLQTVINAGVDTDKFLVLDGSGNVDYRTGTEVLSDIGGAPALSLTTNYIPKAASPTTLDDSDIYQDTHGNIGINTTTPRNLGASYTFATTPILLNLYEGSSSAQLNIQGNSGAYINLFDLAGAADDKWIQLKTDAGILQFRSLTDAGGINVDDILVMDIGTGNIGIGTATPNTKLEINGNLRVSTVVNAGTDTDKFLVWDAQNNVDYRTGTEVLSDIGAVSGYGSGTANRLAYWSDANTITADANLCRSATGLGIGTSTCSYKLTVLNGSDSDDIVRVYGADLTEEYLAFGCQRNIGSNDEAVITFGNLEITNTDLIFKSWTPAAVTEYMRIIGTNGKTVIGSLGAADSRLHVFNASAGAIDAIADTVLTVENNDNAYINLLSPSGSVQGIIYGDAGDNDIGQTIYDHSDNHMSFVINAAERMRIESDGKVGIGTTSPSQFLDVTGGDYYRQIVLSDNKTNVTEKRGAISGHHYTIAEEPIGLIGYYSDASQTIVSIAGGLGATGDFNSATEIQFHTAANITTTNTTAVMVIDSNGNIGIGINSPDGTLHAHTSTAGAVTAGTPGNDLIVEKGNDVGVSLLCPASKGGFIYYGSPNNNAECSSGYLHGAASNTGFYYIYAGGNECVKLAASDGGVYFASLLGASGGADARYDTTTKELFYDTSALKYKENIRTEINTSWIYNLPVVMYDRKDGSRMNEIGIIAEELEALAPEYCCYNENDEIESYCKPDLVPILINEIQNLNKRIEVLEMSQTA